MGSLDERGHSSMATTMRFPWSRSPCCDSTRISGIFRSAGTNTYRVDWRKPEKSTKNTQPPIFHFISLWPSHCHCPIFSLFIVPIITSSLIFIFQCFIFYIYGNNHRTFLPFFSIFFSIFSIYEDIVCTFLVFFPFFSIFFHFFLYMGTSIVLFFFFPSFFPFFKGVLRKRSHFTVLDSLGRRTPQ